MPICILSLNIPFEQRLLLRFCRTITVQTHNLQGDTVGILDSLRILVVECKYDAWGRLLSITGTLADTLSKRNPFRYRGYVYDEETGLYYLQSRYYCPLKCRYRCLELDIDCCCRWMELDNSSRFGCMGLDYTSSVRCLELGGKYCHRCLGMDKTNGYECLEYYHKSSGFSWRVDCSSKD